MGCLNQKTPVKLGTCYASESRQYKFPKLTIKQALANIGGLSNPSKMPCYGYSIPAKFCKTGSKLAKVKGSVCNKCYALDNFYRMPVVENALQLRYEITMKALDNISDRAVWIESFVYLLNNRKQDLFRWHDAGDIKSVDHLIMIVEVAEQTPQIRHWLPTKESKMVEDYFEIYGGIPSNLSIRLSGNMVDKGSPTKLANRLGIQTSSVTTKGDHSCVAYKQEGECRDCTMCWDTSNMNTSYPLH